MKKKSLILGSLIFIILVYMVIKFVQTYKNLNPFLSNLFENYKNIKHNQSLESSIFVFKNIDNDFYKINIKNNDYILHFWDLDNRTCIKEIDFINKHLSEKPMLLNKLLIITNDSLPKIKKFIKENKIIFNIYKYDTTTLPLKHKNLTFPYTIVLKGDSIHKIFVSNKELFNNEIKKLK